jgi:hypothetical protein
VAVVDVAGVVADAAGVVAHAVVAIRISRSQGCPVLQPGGGALARSRLVRARTDANADCADVVIVPTLTRHVLQSRRFLLATSAQPLRVPRHYSCASARLRAQDLLAVTRSLATRLKENAGTDEVLPSGR